MKKLLMLLIALPVIAVSLLSCAYTPMWIGMGTRVEQLSALEPYTVAKEKIPLLPAGHIRIYVYRPQAFLGMFGSAVVIINGKWLGDAKRKFVDNLLLPGTVFIVDTPVDVARVWWYQDGKGEETDKALSLPSTEAHTWYLKWGIKPTYGYLKIVTEQQAISEIESLKFSGYVKL